MGNGPTKEKSVAFIVARLSSSRLPSKHFRRIGDRSLLEWVVGQLWNSKELDEIVLATVNEPENRPLQDFAEKSGLACYWYGGEVDHVTTRLRRAAEKHEADICVLVSADCPLIYSPAIDQLICSLRENPDADTVRLAADAYGYSPALQGIVASRKKAWQLADDLADRPELKEHQFPVIGLRPELFHPVEVRLPDVLYMKPHRLSVDTLADLEFMNALYLALKSRHLPFELPDAVVLLREQPDLKVINRHVHQRKLVETIKKVLFVVDAGGSYGLGHLMRCGELARQITERLGWPTHFVVDDEQVKNTIEARGHKTYWGAFGRPANQNTDLHPSLSDTIISAYDLLIFDIFDQRGPNSGWRSKINLASNCIVIENTQPWTQEADLIVHPNILDKFPLNRHLDDPLPRSGRASTTTPKVIGGAAFIILRREIRQLLSSLPEKRIDVLVYLHDSTQREILQRILCEKGLTFKIMDGFEAGFADDLVTSRIFVSGFGVSFYEALALQTIPVCWPDSESHRDDAQQFFRHCGMTPLVINSPADIEATIMPLLENLIRLPKPFQDGTPNIVAEIAALFDTPRL
jgi:spore coat polysaccharide biosynthesis protein SpsF